MSARKTAAEIAAQTVVIKIVYVLGGDAHVSIRKPGEPFRVRELPNYDAIEYVDGLCDGLSMADVPWSRTYEKVEAL
jgi:hypothetical protein